LTLGSDPCDRDWATDLLGRRFTGQCSLLGGRQICWSLAFAFLGQSDDEGTIDDVTASTGTPNVRAPARWSPLGRLWRHGDGLFGSGLWVAAALIVLLLIGIGAVLALGSQLSLDKFGLSFLWTSVWDPALTKEFGALPYIWGTVLTSFLALLIAVPIGLGAAIALAELAPAWIAKPLGLLVELLAAVPSVIFGLWGLYVMVPTIVKPLEITLSSTLGWIPLFKGPVSGPSRLAAGIILAIMILPTITAISRDVFRAIPNDQKEAALGLGATPWETIRKVLVPYGATGFLGAIFLSLARALGETIAVTMVIGNNLDLSLSVLHPGYTMASVIANEFTEATYPLYTSALVEVGLVLFAMTLLINMAAQLLVGRVRRRASQ
jgi:phosphate transport system permease protein